MYSGFITSKRAISALGVHQRFDKGAYRLVRPFVRAGSFPAWRQIRHFEGANGPDGLKSKSPGRQDPGHLYDPISERGELIELIDDHYQGLVQALVADDQVRAGFEAAWLAHYICDGLTPAHHAPLDHQLAYYSEGKRPRSRRLAAVGGEARRKYPVIMPGVTAGDSLRRSWAVWGGKGVMTSHFNFEFGVATALAAYPIKAEVNEALLARARQVGPLNYFKEEARTIATLRLYERFSETGWNAELARLVRRRLAPVTVQAIAVLWLLAYLEAEQRRVVG